MRTGDTLLRDPTPETAATRRAPVPPPSDLRAGTVALLDIGKMRGDEFVDRLAAILAARGLRLKRWKKPTNTRTAPLPILHAIAAEASAVIIALSDCGSCTSCSTHDLNDLDHRGIPGVNVLTEEFRDAFDRQCTSLGFDGRSVFVPHPILNRTTKEIHAIADAFADEIVASLRSRAGPATSAIPSGSVPRGGHG